MGSNQVSTKSTGLAEHSGKHRNVGISVLVTDHVYDK